MKQNELSTQINTKDGLEKTAYTGSTSNKKEMENMFDSISGRYDFLNHFLSANVDKRWRKKAVNELVELKPDRVLDMATGTADLAIEANRLNPSEIVGIDLSNKMLDVGRTKLQKKGLTNIRLEQGDSENIQYPDDSFDACTVGFGVRNFENLEAGLKEINRVLRPGGKLVVLEFSMPTAFPMKQIYWLYQDVFMPIWGKLFAGNSSAYTYLPESVKRFPDGKDFTDFMERCGFSDTKQRRLTFGICSIYTGTK